MRRRMLYLQYTNPANYPPLEHGGLILLKAGWEVRYFGTQSEGASNQLVFPEPLAGRVARWRHQAPGIRQKLHFLAFTLRAFWWALWRRPDWVYCSDLMSCPAAWLIRHWGRTRVAYHEHDSPEVRSQKSEVRGHEGGLGNKTPEAEGGRKISAFQRFLLWTRKRVGRDADLVVLPNQKRLELFCQTTGRQKPSLCAFNCPRKEEAEKQSLKTETLKLENGDVARGSGNGVLRLAFHGSINRDRLPMTVLEAMGRLPGRVHLSVVGYETLGAKNYMRDFIAAAARLRVDGFVDFLGALPRRADILAQSASSDIGLAFMPLAGGDVNLENMTGASNKPFDYLACGLALLVSARPDWEEMFVQPGYGLSCGPNDADSIAKRLRWFLEHPAETRQMGERGRHRILQDWNYETQFAPVKREIERALPPGAGA